MADIYRIGIAISLTNNVSAALRIIQRDVLGLGESVDLTQGKMNRLKLAVIGAGTAFAGLAALKGFELLAKAGGELLDQQQRILASGATHADLAKETATAYQMMSISGSELVQNLKMVADLRSVLGFKNLGEAQALAPSMMKAGIAAGNMTGIDPEKAAYNIALIEDRLGYTLNQKTGQLDAARAGDMAKLIDAIIAGTNGRVDTRQLLNFSQRALASGKLLSTEGLVNLVPVIQAMGGDIAGTALTAYDKAFVGGVMTTRGTSWLERLGLVGRRSVHREGAGYARLDPDAIAGSGIAGLDPQTWVNRYLIPALRREVGPKGSLQDMLKVLAQSGFANTTVRFLSELVGSSVQNAKDVQNIQVAAGTDQYSKIMQSLTGAEGNFTSALQSLWQALGLPAAKMGVTILNSLSAGIRNFVQWVGAHPGYADAMDKTLLGLGAALTVLGTAATIAAIASLVGSGGTIALVAAGLVALGGAFYELPGAIREMGAAWKPISGWFSGLVSAFGSMAKPSQSFGGWLSAMAKAITGMDHPFQTLGNDFHLAIGWVSGLATALADLLHPIQAVQSLIATLTGSAPPAGQPPVDIHGTAGRRVPTAPSAVPGVPTRTMSRAIELRVPLQATASGPVAPMAPAPVPAPSSTHGGYGRHVPNQSAEADIASDNAVLADWVRNGAAVTVKNTRDLANAQDARSSRKMRKPNTGASGVNLRLTPSGSAALAMPGYG